MAGQANVNAMREETVRAALSLLPSAPNAQYVRMEALPEVGVGAPALNSLGEPVAARPTTSVAVRFHLVGLRPRRGQWLAAGVQERGNATFYVAFGDLAQVARAGDTVEAAAGSFRVTEAERHDLDGNAAYWRCRGELL